MTEELWEKYIAYYKEKSGNAISNGDLLIDSNNAKEEILRRLKLQETQQELLEQLKRICIDYKDNLLTDNEFRICILEELEGA